mgnify:CR=1 FL=1
MNNKNKNTPRIKNTPTAQIESVVLQVSKSTLKKQVAEKAKKRQLRLAKKLLKDPLIFTI